MGRKCVVPNCTSGYTKNTENVSLFAIPKDSLKEYNRAIPRKDRVLTKKDHVCEKHFTPECIIRELKTECYTIPLKVPKLQKGSLPTIFPNCPKYISESRPQKLPEIIKYDGAQVKRRRPSAEVKVEKEIIDIQLKQEIIENSDADEIGENSSDKIDVCDFSFDTLWGNHEVLSLPSSLWRLHLIPDIDNNLIAVTKLVPFKNNVLLEKKIVVNKNFKVDCYIFEHPCNIAQNIEIINIEQLKNFLIEFDNLSVCYGSFVNVSDNFKSKVYYKDVYCQTWRHSKCDFVIQASVNSEHDFSQKKCNFCGKFLKS